MHVRQDLTCSYCHCPHSCPSQEASIAEAVSLYSRALSIFLWFDRGPGNASEDIPLIDSTRSITDSQQAELATQLCAVLLNNQATCMLRLGRFPDCIYAAR